MICDVKVIWPITIKYAMEYIAGLVVGDGQIESKRVTITDASIGFLREVDAKVVKKLGLKAYIHKRSDANAYYMRIYGKEFVGILGNSIIKLKKNPTTNFIRGFFDAEGTITIEQQKYIVIEMSQHGALLVKKISGSLKNKQIYSYMKHQEYMDKRRGKKYTRYILRIKRQSSVARFLKIIGIRHPKHIVKIKTLCLRPL